MKIYSDSFRLRYWTARELRRSSPYHQKSGLVPFLTDTKGEVAFRPGDIIRVSRMELVLNRLAPVYDGELSCPQNVIRAGFYPHDALLEDFREFLARNVTDLYLKVFHGKHGLVSQDLPYQERERGDRDGREQPVTGVPAAERHFVRKSVDPFIEPGQTLIDVVKGMTADINQFFHITQQYKGANYVS